MSRFHHSERHRTHNVGWLRAAVLGANDGIVSTASLVLGVAAAHQTTHEVLVAGIAGLVAGAMSMATGEYVSVHSQADVEEADLERERHELASDRDAEHNELKAIYEGRGLDPALADQVATQRTTPWKPTSATSSAFPSRCRRDLSKRHSPRRRAPPQARSCRCWSS